MIFNLNLSIANGSLQGDATTKSMTYNINKQTANSYGNIKRVNHRLVEF